MEFAPVIFFVGFLVFLAHLFVALFERTRVPDVLYLVLIGVIIGPMLHIVSPADFGKIGEVFTTIALVVILFEGGLELSLENLTTSLRGTMVITLVSYVVAFAFTTAAIIWLIDPPLIMALFVGAVLAGPAPAIVIPLVKQLKLAPKTKATLTLEAPLGEALSIIVGLAILESVKYETFQVGFLIGKLLSSFGFALVIGLVGGFLWSVLLHKVRELRHAIFTTPSFILVLFGVAEFLGFSGPLAALTFGVTLGNAGTKEFPWLAQRYNLTPLQHNETEKAFFGEIVFLIKTFFFVYLGLSVKFSDIQTLSLGVILTLVLLVARMVSVRASANKSSTGQKDALIMGVMLPKGTAAAVLASIPLQMGLAGGEQIQNIMYSVVVISIIVTAVLIFLLERTPLGKVFKLAFLGYPVFDEAAQQEVQNEAV